jgi:hypothetical protein
MTTKEAVPQKLPLPQIVSRAEMDERALLFAATSLIERLNAVDHDVGEVGVQALVFNLQNLMRLFDLPTYECEVKFGVVVFTRSVSRGDWETGRGAFVGVADPWRLSEDSPRASCPSRQLMPRLVRRQSRTVGCADPSSEPCAGPGARFCLPCSPPSSSDSAPARLKR